MTIAAEKNNSLLKTEPEMRLAPFSGRCCDGDDMLSRDAEASKIELCYRSSTVVESLDFCNRVLNDF